MSVPAAKPAAHPARPADRETVEDVVLRYLRAQRDTLRDGESGLRIGEAVVHWTRVSIRRFRSTLRTFSDVFADDLTVPLAEELRWYAEVLGHVRDREVQRERLAATIAELAPNLVRGSVADDIEATLAAEQEAYEADVLAVLDGPRYQALLIQLDEWLADPPSTERARRPAKKVGEHVVKAERTVVRQLAYALKTNVDDDFHSARKAGKRARYAAELAAEYTGKQAQKQLERLTAVQDQLGEFQDSIVASETILRLSELSAQTPGQDGFTYGVLYATERERSHRARAQAAELVVRLVKKH
jgi:CHAD domain-containing protein